MQLFVFDIDGTITNSVAAHQRSFEKALEDVGVSVVDKNWGGYTHHTDSWIFSEVFRRSFGRDPLSFEKTAFSQSLADNFEAEILAKPLPEIPGATAFLRQVMSDSGRAYAFATGSYRRPAFRKLAAIGLTVPIELLVTADDFETREDIVANAMIRGREYFNVTEFDRVVSIGDGLWDFLTAQNLKLDFVGIAAGLLGEKLREAGAVNVFPDFLAPGVATCQSAQAAHNVWR